MATSIKIPTTKGEVTLEVRECELVTFKVGDVTHQMKQPDISDYFLHHDHQRQMSQLGVNSMAEHQRQNAAISEAARKSTFGS